MKILILSDRIPPENKGGAEVIAWNLAKGLQSAGHEVQVIASTDKADFEDVREGIQTYHIHSQYPERFRAYVSLYNPQTLGKLKQLYERIQPDVVNAHNVHAHLSYSALSVAYRMGVQTVFSSHDVMPIAYAKLMHTIQPPFQLPGLHNLKQMRFRFNPLRNRWIRHILMHHTAHRTAVSHGLKTALETNGLPTFEVVHNGIDVSRFQAKLKIVNQLRDRWNLANRKVILFAGRLTSAKGVLPVLRALNRLKEAIPEALLLVLSAQPIEAQIPPEFGHLQDQHILSGGWLQGDELVSAYQVADVVVVPSIYLDPFPTVNLEAMASGKPVIATCYGGSSEAVVDGETGYIIDPLDTATFVGRLTRLLTNDELAKQMGQAGYKRVQSQFSLEKQVDVMMDLYKL